MNPITVLQLATAIIGHYRSDRRSEASLPSAENLANLLKKLTLSEVGDSIDLTNVQTAVADALKALTFLNGGAGDFVSKSAVAKFLDRCLGGVGSTRPKLDNVVKDYHYFFKMPLPTVNGDVKVAKILVRHAFQAWQSVCGITLRMTARESSADLIITQRTLDAAPEVLAIATVGNPGNKLIKELVFDTAEGDWKDSGKFFLTACHEIGHLLGLVHEGARGEDLMRDMLVKSIDAATMSEVLSPNGDFVVRDLALGNRPIADNKTLFSANDRKRASATDLWGPPPEDE